MPGPQSADPVLQLRGVTQEFPGRRRGVLRRRTPPDQPLAGLDLTVQAGEVAWVVAADATHAALTGILAGAAPNAGSVLLSGRDVTRRSRRQRARLARQLVVLGGAGDALDVAGVDSVIATLPAVLVLDLAGASEASEDFVDSAMGAAEQGIAVLVLDRLLPTPAMAAGGVHVLCGGRLVEVLGGDDLAEPMHPYARLLVRPADAGAESPDGETLNVEALPAALPAPQGGCPWRASCELAQARCAREMPGLERPLGATHAVACHFPVVQPPAHPRTAVVPPGAQRAAGEPAFADEPTAREFVDS